jgi:predicted exporter
LLLALAARLGKRGVLRNLAVPVLLAVQIVLAWFGSGTPAVGVLHPINAFLILGLTGSLVYEAWRGTGRLAAPASPATPTA